LIILITQVIFSRQALNFKQMKAIRKLHPQKGIWMEDIPVPVPGVNEVLIKISKSAICGTDLHIYEWNGWAQKTIKTPMTIGHEYVGKVVEIGNEVTKIKMGGPRYRGRAYCLRILPKLPPWTQAHLRTYRRYRG
jgi:hypothetical protein